jgi:hypothetical protein
MLRRSSLFTAAPVAALLLVTVAALTACSSPKTGCAKDTDCKGDRVCAKASVNTQNRPVVDT